MSDERFKRARLDVQLQETLRTVADQEPPVRRRFETQRPAASPGDLAHRSVLWSDGENPPVEKPRVDQAIGADHDILRPLAGQRDEVIGGQ